MAEFMPHKCKALASIANTAKEKRRRRKKREDKEEEGEEEEEEQTVAMSGVCSFGSLGSLRMHGSFWSTWRKAGPHLIS